MSLTCMRFCVGPSDDVTNVLRSYVGTSLTCMSFCVGISDNVTNVHEVLCGNFR